MTENKHTNEDLKEMQSWSLERKVRVTQTRIIEWYEHYKGQVYVSFSGGKDSTVLLDLTRRIYPDVEAVFVDTGLEYPEIREFVKTKENVTWLKPKMSFKEVINNYGYPVISKRQAQSIREAKNTKSETLYKLRMTGIRSNGEFSPYSKISEKWKSLVKAPFEVSEQCCSIMKKKPMDKYVKQTGKHPIIGTMTSESISRKNNWLKQGCNAFDKTNPSSQPLSFWTEQDVLTYLKEFSIPFASVYGDIIHNKNKLETSGVSRTGCMFCMFGVHLEKEPNRFQRMKITHPQLYDYCIRPVEENGLGLGEVLDYIGVKYE